MPVPRLRTFSFSTELLQTILGGRPYRIGPEAVVGFCATLLERQVSE